MTVSPMARLEVVVSNTGAGNKTVRYSEVFSSFMVQMTPSVFGPDRRAFASTHYNSSFSILTRGAAHSRKWLGLSAAEAEQVERQLGNRTLPEGASVFDVSPPTSFLVSLSNQEVYETIASSDGQAFFGPKGTAFLSCFHRLPCAKTVPHLAVLIRHCWTGGASTVPDGVV